MDARIAKALRNSPHRNELKYLYLLSNIKNEERKREVIRLYLPSLRILCETVRRFMCVGDDFDLQTARILWKHPVAALLTHGRLVDGLIIVQEYRAIQVAINFERFLDLSLVEVRRLRVMTSSQLFSTPVQSPPLSLRSASSVSSLVSLPGSAAGTPLSTPTRQRLTAARRRLIFGLQSLSIIDEAEEDFVPLSQVSWRSVREAFQSGISDEERRRRVTIEEFDVSMSSINSQDLNYQREYFTDYLQFGEGSWTCEDYTGFGSPGIGAGRPQSIMQLDLSLPPEGGEGSARRVATILEFPKENQPFPTGVTLKTLIEQAFFQDAVRRPSNQTEMLEVEWQPGMPHPSPQPGRPPVIHPVEETSSAVPGPAAAPSTDTHEPMDTHEPTDTREPTGRVEAATGGQVFNPAWAPFPIYVDTPEPTPQPAAVASSDLAQPQPSCSHHHDVGSLSAIQTKIVPPDPDFPVLVFPLLKKPLADITSFYKYTIPVAPQAPKKIRRKLGPMKSRLKFQSTRLYFHCSVIRNRISNPRFKIRDGLKDLVKISKPKVIKLDDPVEERCPRKSDLPVVETSDFYVPLIAPEPGEDLYLAETINRGIELEDTLSRRSRSWETFDDDDDDDDPWIVSGLPDECPALEEDILDAGWLYQHQTDPFLWQRKKRTLPPQPNVIPEFPPKFRYKRAPVISLTVLRYYPDWQTRRHPSEIPPPPLPAPLPAIPEVFQPVVEEVATEVQTGATATTSGIVPGEGMITGSSTSQVPSAGLVKTASDLEPHTFSSLVKKTIPGASGEELQLHNTEVPSTSGPGLTLPSLEGGEKTTTVISQRPGEEGAAGISAGPDANVPGVTGEPGVTAVAEGPGAPGETAVAEVPAPPGAVPPSGDFQFAVPEPVVRPRRIRRVPPRYVVEYDWDDEDEPPRRRKRRRRRVREVAEVPPRPRSPPPPPTEAEPMDFGEAGLIPPLPLDPGSSAVESPELETPNVWNPDRVKALLRGRMQEAGERVLRFTDCCEPDVCPRKSAASFFSVLLVLDAQKIISLRQRSKDGSPFELFIEGSDALFDFEETGFNDL